MKKGVSSCNDLIKFIRDLHWSGMIKGDWDPDEHPRWPAGAPDSQGGRFAPKGDGGEGNSSQTSLSDADDRSTRAKTVKPRDSSRRQPTGASAAAPDAGDRTTRIQLADAGMSDAANDPIVEAASRAGMLAQSGSAIEGSERDSPPNIVLAAAEDKEENDPRFGIGGQPPAGGAHSGEAATISRRPPHTIPRQYTRHHCSRRGTQSGPVGARNASSVAKNSRNRSELRICEHRTAGRSCRDVVARTARSHKPPTGRARSSNLQSARGHPSPSGGNAQFPAENDKRRI